MTVILRTPDLAENKVTLRGPRREIMTNNAEASINATLLYGENGAANTEKISISEPFITDIKSLMVHEQEQTEYLNEIKEAAKRAYEESYEAGLRKGDAEGRESYTSGLRQLEVLAQNMNLTVQRNLEESEDLMVSIIFESVCKIIGITLPTKEGVVAIVKEALGHIRGKSALIIRINPLDLELIEEGAAFGVASEADWRADDAIPMGGCVIESEYGTLDARIDTQLNQLKRVLLAAHHKPVEPLKDN